MTWLFRIYKISESSRKKKAARKMNEMHFNVFSDKFWQESKRLRLYPTEMGPKTMARPTEKCFTLYDIFGGISSLPVMNEEYIRIVYFFR